MSVGGPVDGEHLGDAGETRGLARDGVDAVAGDENVDGRAERQRGGQRLGGGVAELSARDVGEEKRRHASTPVSASLATRSGTVPTLEPAFRTGGSLIFKTCSRGVTSTPQASGVVSTIGFFLAFMMFGSEA